MFRVRDYGATGDGITLETAAIQRAIQACAQAGGGVIVFEAGRYLTGAFEIFSNMHLVLEAGATLIASSRLEDYPLTHTALTTPWSGLIFARRASHITISGSGTIDGNGRAFMDMQTLFVPADLDVRYTRQKERYMVEQEVSAGPVRFLDRPGDLLAFFECEQVALRDFTLLNAPFWAIRLDHCQRSNIQGLTILNDPAISNSDGIHLTSSSDVRISGCHIDAGDDCIAITSEGERPERNANIIVSDCLLRSRSAGIRVGIIGVIEDCVFQNLIIQANRGIGIFVRQAEEVRRLIFANLVIHTSLHSYGWWGHGEPIHLSVLRGWHPASLATIREIRFSNIISRAESGILLYGCEERQIEDVSFEGIDLTIVPGARQHKIGGNFDLRPADDPAQHVFAHDDAGLYARHVRGLTIRDFRLRWEGEPADYFRHALWCEQCTSVTIDGFVGRQPTHTPDQAVIALQGVRDVTIRNSTAAPGSGPFLACTAVSGNNLLSSNNLVQARAISLSQDIPFITENSLLPGQ